MQHLVTPPENMLGTAKQKAILHDLKTQEKKNTAQKVTVIATF